MMKTGASLSFQNVTCLRADRILFEGMDFALQPGEAALIAGPNGAGKSSLIRMAAGLLQPAAGHIERRGRLAMRDEKARKRDVTGKSGSVRVDLRGRRSINKKKNTNKKRP